MKPIHLSMRDLNQIIAAELHRGKNTDELIAYLRQRGWPEVSARHFIQNALAKENAKPVSVNEEQTSDAVAPDKGLSMLGWVAIGMALAFFILNLLMSA